MVAKAEAALGFRLPEDLRASLLRHDGTETVLFGPLHEPMSTAQITGSWKDLHCTSGMPLRGWRPRVTPDGLLDRAD